VKRLFRRGGSSHKTLWLFLARRLVAVALLSIGVTLVAFTLSHLVPADPAVAALGERAADSPIVVERFRERHGLNEPVPRQYLNYLGRLVRGDLGLSHQTGRSVNEDLGRVVPASIELALVAVLITIVLGIGLGTIAAINRENWIDQALRVVTLVGVSAPSFWLALVAFYVFFFKLGWAPPGGRLEPGTVAPPQVTRLYSVDALLAGRPDTAWEAMRHLVLPALVLASYSVSVMVRFTRSSVLDVLNADYILAARAKGLPARTILFNHVLRAAFPGVLTMTGLSFATLLSGTVLIEAIFGWPGVGQYAYLSATTLDLNAIMGVTLFIAIVYVVLNFVVDVLYGVIDPRIRVS
jgi:peptide/nickel transport system permease protein